MRNKKLIKEFKIQVDTLKQAYYDITSHMNDITFGRGLYRYSLKNLFDLLERKAIISCNIKLSDSFQKSFVYTPNSSRALNIEEIEEIVIPERDLVKPENLDLAIELARSLGEILVGLNRCMDYALKYLYRREIKYFFQGQDNMGLGDVPACVVYGIDDTDICAMWLDFWNKKEDSEIFSEHILGKGTIYNINRLSCTPKIIEGYIKQLNIIHFELIKQKNNMMYCAAN
ncbi:MAG: hypothetical protein AB7U45_03780 [Desulfamplus sp.]